MWDNLLLETDIADCNEDLLDLHWEDPCHFEIYLEINHNGHK